MKAKRRMKRSREDVLVDTAVMIICILVIIVTVYPILYVFSMSVSEPRYVYSGQVYLFPKGFTLGAYKALLSDGDILMKYFNSIWIVVVGTALNLIMTVFAAYPLSRKKFRRRRPIMLFILFTMFFSGGIIPQYMLVNALGLFNTRWAVVLPVAASSFNIVIARTFFAGISESIEEAAEIDGCGKIGILFRIFMPLSLPVVAVVVLYSAVNHWNSYFTAMLYITDNKLQPIQAYLARILMSNQMNNILRDGSASQQNSYAELVKYAIIMLTTIPIMCIYPFLQRYFISGLTLGSVKE